MGNKYLIDILPTTGKLVSESEPLRIEGKSVSEKKSPSKILKSNLTNSLKLFKERISHLDTEQQAELIKEWESKRKLTKLKRERSLKELTDITNMLKATLITILPHLIKTGKKTRTIILKSPFEKKSYKFKYELKAYGR